MQRLQVLIWQTSPSFDGAHELMVDPTGKVPAQSSGQINVSNNIETNRRHLQNIDHINTTGNVTSVDFATSAQQGKN